MIADSVARKYQLLRIAVGLVLFTCFGACQLETEPDNGSFGEILSFGFSRADNPGLTVSANGSVIGNRITINVPAESDVTSLVPTIKFMGAEVSPASGVAQDFTDPVPYTVITPRGRERVYMVTVVKAASNSKDITHFLIDDVEGMINGSEITVIMPYGTELTMLRGSVIHTGVSIRPESGSVQDFSKPVPYTVTARNGTTATYTVRVSVAESDAKDIIGFAIGNSVGEINGTQITLSLPFGTDVRATAATITHTGLSVSPGSGSLQDFRKPVQYTVVAADGSSQTYTVLVSITPDDAKAITRFSVAGRTAAISGSTINVTVPFETDVEHLTPTIQHNGQSISPASGLEQDFREPVTYTVTAADGSTAQYTVTVTVALNSTKEITAFQIMGRSAQISGTSITLTLPFGTSTASLVPTITYSGASLEPASGMAQNFTDPVDYQVTAADGSTRTYQVTITVAPNDAKEIMLFRFGSLEAEISGTAISVTVPAGTDLTMLAPTITHNGASVAPASGQARNFSTPQTYTVTAQDGSTREYTVTVTIAPVITAFVLASRTGTIMDDAISVTVPFGTSLASLAPSITHTGMSITPGNMVAQNFTQPVVYTVTAANGQTRMYTVTVNVAAERPKNITSFTFQSPSAMGMINNAMNTITVTVPFGTPLTSLTPTITHQGTSIEPMSGTAQNFSSPVMYTVTADDNSTKTYAVTVMTAAGSSAKSITSFAIGATQGMINGTSIAVMLPRGSSLMNLTPSIAISPLATIDPPADQARNFTNPVMYTVTAQDGSSTVYTVTVTVERSSENDITEFDIGVMGSSRTIGANTISVLVPFGTERNPLSPTITVSDGATLSPESGTPQDFSSNVVYTVTAEDGTMRAYTVTVTVAPE